MLMQSNITSETYLLKFILIYTNFTISDIMSAKKVSYMWIYMQVKVLHIKGVEFNTYINCFNV